MVLDHTEDDDDGVNSHQLDIDAILLRLLIWVLRILMCFLMMGCLFLILDKTIDVWYC